MLSGVSLRILLKEVQELLSKSLYIYHSALNKVFVQDFGDVKLCIQPYLHLFPLQYMSIKVMLVQCHLSLKYPFALGTIHLTLELSMPHELGGVVRTNVLFAAAAALGGERRWRRARNLVMGQAGWFGPHWRRECRKGVEKRGGVF